MIHLATGAVEHVSAPPLVPVGQPIDLAHLARMTLGDLSLEREVLQLFGRQADMLVTRMQTAAPAVVAAAAHTLKGSARGIGAWEVADAAEKVELATSAAEAEIRAAVDRVCSAIDEVTVVIAELLRKH
jgi:HPt (histidine-containing phosphotransfer) domain-containing protein